MSGAGNRPWLLPLTPLYRLALGWRELSLRRGSKPVQRLRYPVVSVGNLCTGGAGKTPFVIALATALAGRGLAVDVLSRGYGRRSADPARVNLHGTAEEFGDEPLLIARHANVPVYVSPQRYQAGLLAEADAQHGARPAVHLLDDGFQHRQLHRGIDILLLNQQDWRDRLLPAGNLREPLKAARRATVIAIPAEEGGLEDDLLAWGWQGPVWKLRRRMEIPELNGPVFAFCGIARPGQFFSGLESAGARLAGKRIFRDHHGYSPADVAQLLAAARASGAAALITTEKDQVRLKGVWDSPQPPLLTAGLKITIEDPALDWLVTQLATRLNSTAKGLAL